MWKAKNITDLISQIIWLINYWEEASYSNIE